MPRSLRLKTRIKWRKANLRGLLKTDEIGAILQGRRPSPQFAMVARAFNGSHSLAHRACASLFPSQAALSFGPPPKGQVPLKTQRIAYRCLRVPRAFGLWLGFKDGVPNVLLLSVPLQPSCISYLFQPSKRGPFKPLFSSFSSFPPVPHQYPIATANSSSPDVTATIASWNGRVHRAHLP